jgi:uncharacterized membrane protein
MAAIKVHPHPIAVHFSNGLVPVSVFFLFLFFITRSRDMEIAAFYTLVIGTLGSGLAITTGLYDWKKNYRGAWVPVFKKKLTAGILSVIAGSAACLLRFYHPELLYIMTPLSVIYVALNFFMLGCVTIAGYLGGKLVFQ